MYLRIRPLHKLEAVTCTPMLFGAKSHILDRQAWVTWPSEAKQRLLQVLVTSTKSCMHRPWWRSHSFRLRSALLLAARFVSTGLQSRLSTCNQSALLPRQTHTRGRQTPAADQCPAGWCLRCQDLTKDKVNEMHGTICDHFDELLLSMPCQHMCLRQVPQKHQAHYHPSRHASLYAI